MIRVECGRECGNPRGCLIAGCLKETEEWPEEEAFCERCGQDLQGHKKKRKICDTCIGERERQMWSSLDKKRFPDA